MQREHMSLLFLALFGLSVAVGPGAALAAALALGIVLVYGTAIHLVLRGWVGRRPGSCATSAAATLLALPILGTLVELWSQAVGRPFGWSLAVWGAIAGAGVAWAVAARHAEQHSASPAPFAVVIS